MKLDRFKPLLFGIAILAGAFGIVLVLGAAKPETKQAEAEQPPLVVDVAAAQLKQQTVYASFQGEVRAKTNIELVTQVTGKVTSVSDKFIEGGEFKAGETLLQIDTSDYLVALRSAEASVASAQVDLDMEQATAANRAREWKDLQGKSLDQANPLVLNKPQIDRANARLAAANAELAAANLNYQRTKISAPFDGRIMTKLAELGQFLSRGESIGRVFATQAMEVRIPMTDIQVSELGLRLGYSVQGKNSAKIPAKVSALFGDTLHNWQGYVKSVDASIDAQTRLLFATILVDKPFNQKDKSAVPLVPGLFVDVELASPNQLVGLEFPRTALRNGNQVYAYDNEVLRLRPVTVIYTSRDKVIVERNSSAIEIGEKVVTSPVPGAHEGMSVKLAGYKQLAEAKPAALDSDYIESVDTDLQALDRDRTLDEQSKETESDLEQDDTSVSELEETDQSMAKAR